jgi:hypothetical protein
LRINWVFSPPAQRANSQHSFCLKSLPGELPADDSAGSEWLAVDEEGQGSGAAGTIRAGLYHGDTAHHWI